MKKAIHAAYTYERGMVGNIYEYNPYFMGKENMYMTTCTCELEIFTFIMFYSLNVRIIVNFIIFNGVSEIDYYYVKERNRFLAIYVFGRYISLSVENVALVSKYMCYTCSTV